MSRSRGRRKRRVTVLVPSILTLANLFFGIWSMVLASQGEFYRASWWIVIAGVLDMLDGRIARASNTGTRFGAELDSLVDLVSFGVAPAMLMSHLLFFSLGQYAWMFGYAFVVCVALRLARYNLTTSEAGSSFSGLPSPAAGMTLATYYPFSRTEFFESQLAHLPWSQILIFLTIMLSVAMVSSISYARLPRIGFRTPRGLLGLATHVLIIGFGIFERDIFFFPLGLAYVSYGILRTAVLAFADRGEELAEDPEPSDIHRIDRARRFRRKERDAGP